MNLQEIAELRLTNQQLNCSQIDNIQQLVGWMGAMQAQDYNMVKWAIGMRVPNSTEKDVENAINKGEIIRTHLLRPTWHMVSSDDVYWMLALNAQKIKSSMKARHTFLGLTPEIIRKAEQQIEKMLLDIAFIERDEILKNLINSKIVNNNLQVNHLLTLSEQDAIICSGPEVNNKQTYALLEKRVPRKNALSREESIALLAKKYFYCHGPATLQDFVWWSGLNISEAKQGLEMNKTNLSSDKVGTETYWFAETINKGTTNENSVILLPAFDEYVISYRNRDSIITDKHYQKAISDNGVFRPVILNNGQASGLWKRTIKKNKLIIETEFFRLHNKDEQYALKQAMSAYEIFTEKKIEMKL